MVLEPRELVACTTVVGALKSLRNEDLGRNFGGAARIEAGYTLLENVELWIKMMARSYGPPELAQLRSRSRSWRESASVG